MRKVIAINGSPRMEKGNTALLLDAFIRGVKDAGSEVDVQYASRLKVDPCACGRMYCWNVKKGECCFQDDMQTLYPKLKTAEILVLAHPHIYSTAGCNAKRPQPALPFARAGVADSRWSFARQVPG